MVSMYSFQNIRVLKAAGKNFTQIAEELGLNRSTVRKYAKSNTPPKYKPRKVPSREDPLAPHYEDMERLLERAPKLSASEMFEWLVERGYKGSERTVQRKFKVKRDSKPKERDFEQVYEPGEQSQFDFKESLELPFKGGPLKVNLHVGTLPFSDYVSVKAYPNKNYECFMDGVQSFFETIGGMTKNIRFDNLSPVVKKILPEGGRLYTNKFSAAAKHYGFGLLPCSPGRGNEKGDVERDIQTITRRFLNHVAVEGLVFKDFEELNSELLKFCQRRRSEETRTQFAIESKALLPCPERDEDVLTRCEEVRATDLGTINIMRSIYSVPDEAIGVLCWVVPGPYELKIYRNDTRAHIATHPRKPEKEHSILIEHCLRGLLRKPRAMIRWAHREILFPAPELNAFYNRLRHQDSSGAEREFLRTVNLVQQIPMPEIIAAVGLVLEMSSVSFEAVKELLLVERRPGKILALSERHNQQPIVPNLGAYDELIPKVGGG